MSKPTSGAAIQVWSSVSVGGWAEGRHRGEVRGVREGVTGREYLVHDFDEGESYWAQAHLVRAR